MIFLLQKENEFDMDVLIFKNILDKVKYFHEYKTISLSDLTSVINSSKYFKLFRLMFLCIFMYCY